MATFKHLLTLAVMTSLLSTQAVAFAADASEDTTAPTVVENLAATPGDGMVSLSWDPATDDTGVVDYKVYIGLSPATGTEDDYIFGGEAIGSDLTSFDHEGLTNDLTYYIAVTALDAAGNESEGFSNEVEVTPTESELGDVTAPTVSDAEAITSTMVAVEFSEDVALPEADAAEAFGILASDGNSLEVIDAYVSSDDASIVMLVTSEQTAGAQYMLTAGINVSDLNGNPIESGTSDTAVFTGSSLAEMEDDHSDHDHEEGDDHDHEDEEEEEVVNTEFALDEVESVDETMIDLHFTQEVYEMSVEDVVIQLATDALVEVEILSVEIDEEDATLVHVETAGLEAGEDYVLSVSEALLNKEGEFISVDGLEVEFEAALLELADLIAPEDITNLLTGITSESSILLSFDQSIDSEGDLAHYLVYESLDGGLSFGEAMEYLASSLEASAEIEIAGLTPGETYTFKVAAVDENGNESDGVMTTITLPESGPGMMAMGMFSLLGAGFVARRKED